MDEIADSHMLTHWGLTSSEVACPLVERLDTFNHCKRRSVIADAATRGEMIADSLPCFNPTKVSLLRDFN